MPIAGIVPAQDARATGLLATPAPETAPPGADRIGAHPGQSVEGVIRSAPAHLPGADAPRVVALAEALIVALESAGGRGGSAGSLPSMVIFNAAFMPGWPFPSALVRDAGMALNEKAALHQLVGKIEGLSPEEAAEYLARIGGSFKLLRNLRQLLKELEGIRQDEVKGLLFAFLDAICGLADAVQDAFARLAEAESLQEKLVLADDPNLASQQGRGRLTL